ncbi:Hypothetical_protein [Hexamita inflata]|uniref:Hypothetical_protein n=1 Tax=Hexamita inflata TaxID=28002 RepID=A0ABP1KY33_9EUKA
MSSIISRPDIFLLKFALYTRNTLIIITTTTYNSGRLMLPDLFVTQTPLTALYAHVHIPFTTFSFGLHYWTQDLFGALALLQVFTWGTERRARHASSWQCSAFRRWTGSFQCYNQI